MFDKTPTELLMGTRIKMLNEAIAGYEQTGVPLIASTATQESHISFSTTHTAFYPAGVTDDIALYYLVPKLTQLFEINMSSAINLITFMLLFVGFSFAMYLTLKLAKTKLSKMVAIVGVVLLTYVLYRTGIPYTLQGVLVMVCTLPLIYIDSRKFTLRKWILFFCIMGFILGIAHFFRGYIGIGVLAFAISWFLLNKSLHLKHKGLCLTFLFLGALPAFLFFNHLVQERNDFLDAHHYNGSRASHPLWHSVYIGFGFIDNQYGIVYKDEVAAQKVRSIDKNAVYLEDKYDEILKHEVINLIISDSQFFFTSIFAKLGVCLMFLLIFANIGLIFAFTHRRSLRWHIPFGLGLGASCLFGIAVVPVFPYLSGFIAFATIYGILNTIYAIDRYFQYKKVPI